MQKELHLMNLKKIFRIMKDVKRDILDKITPEIRKEMESIWFTADLHAQHPKIVEICNRPVYVSAKDVKEAGVKVSDVSDPAWKI